MWGPTDGVISDQMEMPDFLCRPSLLLARAKEFYIFIRKTLNRILINMAAIELAGWRWRPYQPNNNNKMERNI